MWKPVKLKLEKYIYRFICPWKQDGMRKSYHLSQQKKLEHRSLAMQCGNALISDDTHTTKKPFIQHKRASDRSIDFQIVNHWTPNFCPGHWSFGSCHPMLSQQALIDTTTPSTAICNEMMTNMPCFSLFFVETENFPRGLCRKCWGVVAKHVTKFAHATKKMNRHGGIGHDHRTHMYTFSPACTIQNGRCDQNQWLVLPLRAFVRDTEETN